MWSPLLAPGPWLRTTDFMLCHLVKAMAYNFFFCFADIFELIFLLSLVPVGKPLLTVLPVPENIEEGNDVTLICGIPKGSPPISFRFYGSNHTAIHTTTVQSNSSSFVLSTVKRKNSGNYYCEAFNTADMSSRSDIVKVEGERYLSSAY